MKFNGEKTEIVRDIADHKEAIEEMLEQFRAQNVADKSEITGVGHRVVAGGEWFNKSVIVDEEVLHKIHRLADCTITIQPMQRELKYSKSCCQMLFRQSSTRLSIKPLPRENYLYPLPYEYYTKYGARKYRSTERSHRYVAERTADILGKPLEELKIITLHLGAGASITAIRMVSHLIHQWASRHWLV